jgi:hypothetical protein
MKSRMRSYSPSRFLVVLRLQALAATADGKEAQQPRDAA